MAGRVEIRGRRAVFLKRQRVARLGTISGDGSVHVVPICYVFDGKAIYIGTEANSKKVKNIRNNNNVTLLVDVYYEDWSRLQSLMIQSRAEIIEKGKEFNYARRLLYNKYRQYKKEAPLEEGDSVIIKIKPERVIAYNI